MCSTAELPQTVNVVSNADGQIPSFKGNSFHSPHLADEPSATGINTALSCTGLANPPLAAPDDAAPALWSMGPSSLDIFASHRDRNLSPLVCAPRASSSSFQEEENRPMVDEPRAIRRRLNQDPVPIIKVSAAIRARDQHDTEEDSVASRRRISEFLDYESQPPHSARVRSTGTHTSHSLWQHGTLVYCRESFYGAEQVVLKLRYPCKPANSRVHQATRRALLEGRHPDSGCVLPGRPVRLCT